MKMAFRLFVLFFTITLTASAALGAPVLKNGDRWPVSSPRAVAVNTVDHLVFMARGNALTVLSDALAVRGRIDLDAEIRCISYSDGYIFAATGSQGLVLVDVTDPTDPQKRSTFTPADGSSVASVFASGSYAYITNVGNKFKIVDVSDPSDPDEIGAEALSGLLVSAVNVHVEGNVAAVADQVNGLHLLNVANKSAPQWESVTPRRRGLRRAPRRRLCLRGQHRRRTGHRRYRSHLKSGASGQLHRRRMAIQWASSLTATPPGWPIRSMGCRK